MKESVLEFIDRFRNILQEDFESIKQKKPGIVISNEKIPFFERNRDKTEERDFR